MAAEHDKHMVHKDLEAKDEEMEQLRYNMQKKASLQFFQFVLFCIVLLFFFEKRWDVPAQQYLKFAQLLMSVVRSVTNVK